MTNKKINDTKGDALSKFFSDNGARVIDVTPNKTTCTKMYRITRRSTSELGKFCKWLEEEPRQNREIERYVEYLIIDKERDIKRKLIKTKILDDKLQRIIDEL